MSLISKTYPASYGGMSEQADELILDTQCREYVNCFPDVVLGSRRRNGTEYVAKRTTGLSSKAFHTYNRGEGDEEYRFIFTGISTDPLRIETKDGIEKTVNYSGTVADIYSYLDGTNLKGLTVQDRTFLVNKDKKITQTTLSAPADDYKDVAYYWLSRSSNDSNNKYNYAVYLDGTTFEYAHNQSDTAATQLASLIDADTDYSATAIGSVIKITSTLSDWTFDWWDSWGNQASYGWKAEANKLSDLPADMPFDGVVIKVVGDDNDEFTDYFLISDNGVWIETRDPDDLRGSFVDMPIRVDRLSDGTFDVDFIDWEVADIGDEDSNPTPSFVDNHIQDIYFFKNRLGFASDDSIILSEEGGYYNFYFKTALEILDADPIDIIVNSTQASKIYHAIPYQNSLYIFTKDAQLSTTYSGTFSPLTVSLDVISNISMKVDVEPKVSGNSLYFVANSSDNTCQLIEYVKDEEKLISKGNDLTLNSPNFLPIIDKIEVALASNIVIMYSTSDKNTLYVYRVKNEGSERIQSALFKWTFSKDIEDIDVFNEDLYIHYEGITESYILKVPILPIDGDKEDEVDEVETTVNFSSYITLPKWYPKLIDIKTPIDNVQIKKLLVYGEGTFNIDIYREGYDTTTSRTYSSGSTKDANASVLGRSNDTVLTIKSNGSNDFKITSYALKGFYRQSSRALK